MKITPILFKGEMIRALRDRRKTMTRRIVKPQPLPELNTMKPVIVNDEVIWERKLTGLISITSKVRCPYGMPGDLLWVREAWRLARINGVDGGVGEFATIQYREGFDVFGYRRDWRDHYADLLEREKRWEKSQTGNLWGRWRPSIHMPRWASRLTLELTGVRVERVQDITEADAQAEGVTQRAYPTPDGWIADDNALFSGGFAALWESINGEESWDENQWVWALKFKVHEQNIDSFLYQRACGIPREVAS